MRRTTMADLAGLVARLNRVTGNNESAWTKDTEGKHRSNVGNYHLDGAYGGWKLVQMDNESGGIRDILHSGFTSKRGLYNLIFAYICGLDERPNNKGETK